MSDSASCDSGGDPQIGVVEKDMVLVWGESPRINTGADILGCLLEGMDR